LIKFRQFGNPRRLREDLRRTQTQRWHISDWFLNHNSAPVPLVFMYMNFWPIIVRLMSSTILNTLNAELNPICHLLALVGAHPVLHISKIRVKREIMYLFLFPKLKLVLQQKDISWRRHYWRNITGSTWRVQNRGYFERPTNRIIAGLSILDLQVADLRETAWNSV
jgi:hypothetical protein